MAQMEIVGSISGNMLHCSAEWNDDSVGQWTSIVSYKEMFLWKTIDPLSQFNASIESPCVIGSAWTHHTKVNESKVCIDNSMHIHSVSLVMTTEVVRCIVNVFWFVDATKPTIDGTNTAMKYSEGARLFIPFSSTPFQVFGQPRNINGE